MKKNSKQDKELAKLIRIAKEKGYKIKHVGLDDFGCYYLVIS